MALMHSEHNELRPSPRTFPSTSPPVASALVRAPPSFGGTPAEVSPRRCSEAAESLELLIRWGSDIVHVAHLTPPRRYVLGESDDVDYVFPAQLLGAEHHSLIEIDATGVHLMVPRGAEIRLRNTPPTSRPLDAGARVAIDGDTDATVILGPLSIDVRAGSREKPLPRSLVGGELKTVGGYLAMTLFATTLFMGAVAAATPPLGLEPDEGLDVDRLYQIRQYLSAAAERELQALQQPAAEDEALDGGEHGNVRDEARGESGSMGRNTVHNRDGRAGVEGPSQNPNPQIPRSEQLETARAFGMIGILNSGDFRIAPSADWGVVGAVGNDRRDAMGNMFGTTLEDAYGSGGLFLSGIGEGGGGRSDQIGMRGIATCTGALCSGPGKGGWGSRGGHATAGHRTRAPQLRTHGTTQVSGRLPPEVIQRVVRQNFGRFRMCFEQGLARNPNLEGRVGVRFLIGGDGRVMRASNGGSDLPDADVVSCVVSAYYGVSFPAPEGGTVTVSYPIMFSPG